MYVVWLRLGVTLLWGPNDIPCISFGSFGRLDSHVTYGIPLHEFYRMQPLTLHSSDGQILTILGKLNFCKSSSVPLQKDLHCNF
jgi:hypothetical protein